MQSTVLESNAAVESRTESCDPVPECGRSQADPPGTDQAKENWIRNGTDPVRNGTGDMWSGMEPLISLKLEEGGEAVVRAIAQLEEEQREREEALEREMEERQVRGNG